MRLPQPRYSLRTFLILIALVAGWLGYHLRLKSQRLALLDSIAAQGGSYQTYEIFEKYKTLIAYPALEGKAAPSWYAEKQPQISRVRAWLGDPPICFINLGLVPSLGAQDEARVAELFPEAQVICGPEKACEQGRFQKLSDVVEAQSKLDPR